MSATARAYDVGPAGAWESCRGLAGCGCDGVLQAKRLSPDGHAARVRCGGRADGAAAVNVPRARFLPVKTCNDLLAVRSDCFVYSEREGLKLNPAREVAGGNEAIKIKLDSTYYGKFDLLEERFREGEPSLKDCDALTINGDVRFERDVVIRGAVAITNNGSRPAVIKAGTVIDRDLTL